MAEAASSREPEVPADQAPSDQETLPDQVAGTDSASADTMTILAGTIKELASVVKDLHDEVMQLKECKNAKPHPSTSILPRKPLTSNWNPNNNADPVPALFGPNALTPLFGPTSFSSSGLFGKPVPEQTFHLFGSLPPELRMRIWKLSLPTDRLFEPQFDPSPGTRHAGLNFSFNAGAINGLNAGLGPLPGQAGNNNANNLVGGGQNGTGAGTNDDRTLYLHHDPPPVRLPANFPPPHIRSVCREARRAASEAGSFEFGVHGTHRRGTWLNHSGDVVFLRPDVLASASSQFQLLASTLGIAHILGFGHTQFKTEAGCLSVLDAVLRYAPRCRLVLFIYDQEQRYGYRPPGAGKIYLHPLAPSDITGNVAFPKWRGIDDDSARWCDMRRVIREVWTEALASRGMDADRAPALDGVDLIRTTGRW